MKAKKNICVIGLGFVGLTIALILAKRGFNVIGVEKNKHVLNLLSKNKSHFFEPGIDSLLKKMRKQNKFNFFSSIPKNCKIDVFMITVGTPLTASKKINISYIKKTTQEVSKLIKDDNLVILRSTVAVGTTKKVVKPILDLSKKKYFLSFCPERTLEGNALNELIKLPQIIGGIDDKSCLLSKNIFSSITKNINIVTDLETAEMIKLVDNANRDVFFAYANEIASICDGYGINANEVISIGKKNYPRTNLPVPGLVGGPCLEKDPHILVEGSKKNAKVFPKITYHSRNLNELQPKNSVGYVKKFVKKKIKLKKKNLKILLCGLAFKGKPKTNDIRGSMAIKVCDELNKNFSNKLIFGYDSMIKKEDVKKFKNLKLVKNLYKSIEMCDVVLILNNHEEFSKINLLKLKKSKPILIYDFWSNLNVKSQKFKNNGYYITLGNHLKVI